MPSNSGINNNGSIQTLTSRGDPFMNAVRDNGHLDIGVSLPVRTGGNVTGGMKFDKNGYTQYIAGGPGYEAKKGLRTGVTALLSTDAVKQTSLDHNITASWGLAMQFSVDNQDITTIRMTGVGIGCCGVDIGAEWTGLTTPWADPKAAEMINFRSKDL